MGLMNPYNYGSDLQNLPKFAMRIPENLECFCGKIAKKVLFSEKFPNMGTFFSELSSTDFTNVYSAGTVDMAWSHFKQIFTCVLDKYIQFNSIFISIYTSTIKHTTISIKILRKQNIEEKTGRPMRPENCLSLKIKVTKHSNNQLKQD